MCIYVYYTYIYTFMMVLFTWARSNHTYHSMTWFSLSCFCRLLSLPLCKVLHNIHGSFCNQLPIDIFAVIDNTAVVRVSLTFCPSAQVLLSVRFKDVVSWAHASGFSEDVRSTLSPPLVPSPGSPHPGWTNPPSLSREAPAWGLVGSMAPTAGAVPSGREQRKFGTGRSQRPGRAANTATALVCLCVN